MGDRWGPRRPLFEPANQGDCTRKAVIGVYAPYMTRVWFTLAGLVMVAGIAHTAYSWGRMDARAEYNSAPSSVSMVYLIPYAFVSVLLLIPPLVARYRRLNSKQPQPDWSPPTQQTPPPGPTDGRDPLRSADQHVELR